MMGSRGRGEDGKQKKELAYKKKNIVDKKGCPGSEKSLRTTFAGPSERVDPSRLQPLSRLFGGHGGHR